MHVLDPRLERLVIEDVDPPRFEAVREGLRPDSDGVDAVRLGHDDRGAGHLAVCGPAHHVVEAFPLRALELLGPVRD
ncbi:hypothetical protein ACFPRL_30310 [Pseudoclavibacter helvolus]